MKTKLLLTSLMLISVGFTGCGGNKTSPSVGPDSGTAADQTSAAPSPADPNATPQTQAQAQTQTLISAPASSQQANAVIIRLQTSEALRMTTETRELVQKLATDTELGRFSPEALLIVARAVKESVINEGKSLGYDGQKAFSELIPSFEADAAFNNRIKLAYRSRRELHEFGIPELAQNPEILSHLLRATPVGSNLSQGLIPSLLMGQLRQYMKESFDQALKVLDQAAAQNAVQFAAHHLKQASPSEWSNWEKLVQIPAPQAQAYIAAMVHQWTEQSEVIKNHSTELNETAQKLARTAAESYVAKALIDELKQTGTVAKIAQSPETTGSENAAQQLMAIGDTLISFTNDPKAGLSAVANIKDSVEETIKLARDMKLPNASDIARATDGKVRDEIRSETQVFKDFLRGVPSEAAISSLLESKFPNARQFANKAGTLANQGMKLSEQAGNFADGAQALLNAASKFGVDPQVVKSGQELLSKGKAISGIVSSFFSGGYLEASSQVLGLFGLSGPDVSQQRHDEVMSRLDAMSKKEDQLVDGQVKTLQGIAALSDGQTQLADGQAKTLQGIAALSDGQAQLADGLNQILAGEQIILQNQQEQEKYNKVIVDGQKQLYEGEKKLHQELSTLSLEMNQRFDEVMDELAHVENEVLFNRVFLLADLMKDAGSCRSLLLDTENFSSQANPTPYEALIAPTLNQEFSSTQDLRVFFNINHDYASRCMVGLNSVIGTKNASDLAFLLAGQEHLSPVEIKKLREDIYAPLFARYLEGSDQLSRRDFLSLAQPMNQTSSRFLVQSLVQDTFGQSSSYPSKNNAWISEQTELRELHNIDSVESYVSYLIQMVPFYELTLNPEGARGVESRHDTLRSTRDWVNVKVGDRVTDFPRTLLLKALQLTNNAIAQEALIAGDQILKPLYDSKELWSSAGTICANRTERMAQPRCFVPSNTTLSQNLIRFTLNQDLIQSSSSVLNYDIALSMNDNLELLNKLTSGKRRFVRNNGHVDMVIGDKSFPVPTARELLEDEMVYRPEMYRLLRLRIRIANLLADIEVKQDLSNEDAFAVQTLLIHSIN